MSGKRHNPVARQIAPAVHSSLVPASLGPASDIRQHFRWGGVPIPSINRKTISAVGDADWVWSGLAQGWPRVSSQKKGHPPRDGLFVQSLKFADYLNDPI